MNAKDYKSMLWALMPQGMAWPREHDSAEDNLLGAEAAELARVDERAQDLIEECDPQTTAEMITDWERVVGLPDECSKLGTTLNIRRGDVVNKLITCGDMRPSFYLQIAHNLGYTNVTIREWNPFECGFSQCGGRDMLGAVTIRHVWSIEFHEPVKVDWFRAGASRCGDHLGIWPLAWDLICRIEKLKPAHTRVLYIYRETERELGPRFVRFRAGESACGDSLGRFVAAP